jgi:hypothetical protein
MPATASSAEQPPGGMPSAAGGTPSAAGGTPSAEWSRLPAAIPQLLASVRRRTRRWIWIEFFAVLGLAVAGFFWVSLALDRLLEPPQWVRIAMLLIAAAGLAWLALGKLLQRIAIPLSDRSLALLVERHHPHLRESLVTAVELASGPPRPDEPVNERLLERTTADAVAGLPGVRLGSLFRSQELATLFFGGLLAAATVGAFAAASPAVVQTWFARVVLLDDTPWPRRTRLLADEFPGGVRKVARGSDVDVLVAADTTKLVPEFVEMRWRLHGLVKTARMGRRGGDQDGRQAFGHVLENVSEDILFSVRGGDDRLEDLRLEVVDAPALAEFEIRYTLPEYLARSLGADERRAASAGLVEVPAGSAVRLECRSTKPLAGGSITLTNAGETTTISRLDEPLTEPTEEILAGLEDVSGESTIGVHLLDTDGLANIRPIGFVLSAVPDRPPQVALRLYGISSAVTPAARVPLVGSISDDHGLERIEAVIDTGDAGSEGSTRPLSRLDRGMTVLEYPEASPEVIDLSSFGLSPGGSLRLTVIAGDAAGEDGPREGRSDTWTLPVVTPAELSAMLEARELLLRRRFESVVNDLGVARDTLASAADPVPERLAQAAARAAGETGEIAEAFRMIRMEFENNGLLSPELEMRLSVQIAAPLAEIAKGDLPDLAARARRDEEGDSAGLAARRERLVARTDAVLARMRAVLARMMELETFNEVVELLREAISSQESIREETRRIQRERAREALEGLEGL